MAGEELEDTCLARKEAVAFRKLSVATCQLIQANRVVSTGVRPLGHVLCVVQDAPANYRLRTVRDERHYTTSQCTSDNDALLPRTVRNCTLYHTTWKALCVVAFLAIYSRRRVRLSGELVTLKLTEGG